MTIMTVSPIITIITLVAIIVVITILPPFTPFFATTFIILACLHLRLSLVAVVPVPLQAGYGILYFTPLGSPLPEANCSLNSLKGMI